MKPYRVQWLNVVSAEKPWVNFVPDAVVLASDEANAISTVIAAVRKENSYFINNSEPLRAVEISWKEYKEIKK